jgi:hypothetical protein
MTGVFARMCVRFSVQPSARGGQRVALCAADAAPWVRCGYWAAGDGVRGSVADGAGRPKVRTSAQAIRAYGALARDAPSLPSGPSSEARALPAAGTMARLWFAAGMLEANHHQFRHVNGPRAPAELRAALEDHFKTVSGAGQNDQQAA